MARVDEVTEEVCGCRWVLTWEGEVVYQIKCERHAWAEKQDHIKISIESERGNAYVSYRPYPDTIVHYGVNKHSDAPVSAIWNETTETWMDCQKETNDGVL